MGRPDHSKNKRPSSAVLGHQRKVTKKEFVFVCEWIGCDYTTDSISCLNHHVSAHRRGYTACLGDDSELEGGEYAFYCHWQDCGAQIVGELEDFCRHVFYHTFHQHLKHMGQHIIDVDNIKPCTLDRQSRNVIPELPEKLQCRWGGCGEAFDNPYLFYYHVSFHTDEMPKGNGLKNPVKCKWEDCSATTKTRYKMKEHIRSHTQAKVVACPTCGALFSNNTKFLDHIKRQNPEMAMNFQCTHCNRVFCSERLLRDHSRRHVNHYKCPMCDMTCNHPSGLRDHIRYRHSDMRDFHCPKCDYMGKSHKDMYRHLEEQHEKDKEGEFQCGFDKCRLNFTNLKDLFMHREEEHEDPPRLFQCHICHKDFTRGNILSHHLIDVHDFNWPSGHRRFRYKLQDDGYHRLQTVRYESLEVTEQILGRKLTDEAGKDNTSHSSPFPPPRKINNGAPTGESATSAVTASRSDSQSYGNAMDSESNSEIAETEKNNGQNLPEDSASQIGPIVKSLLSEAIQEMDTTKGKKGKNSKGGKGGGKGAKTKKNKKQIDERGVGGDDDDDDDDDEDAMEEEDDGVEKGAGEKTTKGGGSKNKKKMKKKNVINNGDDDDGIFTGLKKGNCRQKKVSFQECSRSNEDGGVGVGDSGSGFKSQGGRGRKRKRSDNVDDAKTGGDLNFIDKVDYNEGVEGEREYSVFKKKQKTNTTTTTTASKRGRGGRSRKDACMRKQEGEESVKRTTVGIEGTPYYEYNDASEKTRDTTSGGCDIKIVNSYSLSPASPDNHPPSTSGGQQSWWNSSGVRTLSDDSSNSSTLYTLSNVHGDDDDDNDDDEASLSRAARHLNATLFNNTNNSSSNSNNTNSSNSSYHRYSKDFVKVGIKLVYNREQPLIVKSERDTTDRQERLSSMPIFHYDDDEVDYNQLEQQQEEEGEEEEEEEMLEEPSSPTRYMLNFSLQNEGDETTLVKTEEEEEEEVGVEEEDDFVAIEELEIEDEIEREEEEEVVEEEEGEVEVEEVGVLVEREEEGDDEDDVVDVEGGDETQDEEDVAVQEADGEREEEEIDDEEDVDVDDDDDDYKYANNDVEEEEEEEDEATLVKEEELGELVTDDDADEIDQTGLVTDIETEEDEIEEHEKGGQSPTRYTLATPRDESSRSRSPTLYALPSPINRSSPAQSPSRYELNSPFGGSENAQSPTRYALNSPSEQQQQHQQQQQPYDSENPQQSPTLYCLQSPRFTFPPRMASSPSRYTLETMQGQFDENAQSPTQYSLNSSMESNSRYALKMTPSHSHNNTPSSRNTPVRLNSESFRMTAGIDDPSQSPTLYTLQSPFHNFSYSSQFNTSNNNNRVETEEDSTLVEDNDDVIEDYNDDNDDDNKVVGGSGGGGKSGLPRSRLSSIHSAGGSSKGSSPSSSSLHHYHQHHQHQHHQHHQSHHHRQRHHHHYHHQHQQRQHHHHQHHHHQHHRRPPPPQPPPPSSSDNHNHYFKSPSSANASPRASSSAFQSLNTPTPPQFQSPSGPSTSSHRRVKSPLSFRSAFQQLIKAVDGIEGPRTSSPLKFEHLDDNNDDDERQTGTAAPFSSPSPVSNSAGLDLNLRLPNIITDKDDGGEVVSSEYDFNLQSVENSRKTAAGSRHEELRSHNSSTSPVFSGHNNEAHEELHSHAHSRRSPVLLSSTGDNNKHNFQSPSGSEYLGGLSNDNYHSDIIRSNVVNDNDAAAERRSFGGASSGSFVVVTAGANYNDNMDIDTTDIPTNASGMVPSSSVVPDGARIGGIEDVVGCVAQDLQHNIVQDADGRAYLQIESRVIPIEQRMDFELETEAEPALHYNHNITPNVSVNAAPLPLALSNSHAFKIESCTIPVEQRTDLELETEEAAPTLLNVTPSVRVNAVPLAFSVTNVKQEFTTTTTTTTTVIDNNEAVVKVKTESDDEKSSVNANVNVTPFTSAAISDLVKSGIVVIKREDENEFGYNDDGQRREEEEEEGAGAAGGKGGSIGTSPTRVVEKKENEKCTHSGRGGGEGLNLSFDIAHTTTSQNNTVINNNNNNNSNNDNNQDGTSMFLNVRDRPINLSSTSSSSDDDDDETMIKVKDEVDIPESSAVDVFRVSASSGFAEEERQEEAFVKNEAGLHGIKVVENADGGKEMMMIKQELDDNDDDNGDGDKSVDRSSWQTYNLEMLGEVALSRNSMDQSL